MGAPLFALSADSFGRRPLLRREHEPIAVKRGAQGRIALSDTASLKYQENF